ncbi:zinc-dependent alcohol dehydrogenase family protein [Nocardia blacklockiae]|uniref:zinc-dependent alcohol dehydrogenase family protein n=1 Tax=Nocardia blacklockiae TaxID=480036 RepID=UPI0018944CBB|nr:NAD(P)-dependent alcohol dehydrogenase [Nocardia blacklockiae]MBF6171015.1 NAD(P)-dependent alcohol dehydrogenase [Nocardia blacklockiae]
MRAYQFEATFSLGSLRLVDRPDPVPGERDVVLRMQAAALNYRDLAIMRGKYHVPVALPLVPLSDGVGEVVHVGGAVSRFRVGDFACPVFLPDWVDGPIRTHHGQRRLGGPTDGVLAELLCLHEDEAVRVPGNLEPAQAATLPVAGATVWHSLFELDRLRPDETILVQGSGGVSTLAVQLAATAGARVIATSRSARHAQRLQALGADQVLCSGANQDWPNQIAGMTGGGADVALNVAGGDTLTPTVAATRVGGRVHLMGYTADRAAELDIFTAIQRATTIRTATGGSRTDFEALVTTIERHALMPVVDKVFPLGRLADAFDRLAHGGHFGKIVIATTF